MRCGGCCLVVPVLKCCLVHMCTVIASSDVFHITTHLLLYAGQLFKNTHYIVDLGRQRAPWAFGYGGKGTWPNIYMGWTVVELGITVQFGMKNKGGITEGFCCGSSAWSQCKKRARKNQMWNILRTIFPFIRRLNNDASLHAPTHTYRVKRHLLWQQNPHLRWSVNCSLDEFSAIPMCAWTHTSDEPRVNTIRVHLCLL